LLEDAEGGGGHRSEERMEAAGGVEVEDGWNSRRLKPEVGDDDAGGGGWRHWSTIGRSAAALFSCCNTLNFRL
jgi:hypothetical protein